MQQALQQLSKKLEYSFKDIRLLDSALRHRSLGSPNNERLEFLGDSVLGLVISQELFLHFPQAEEGELSRKRSFLVNREVLAQLALDLELDQYLHLGPGERRSGGSRRQSILADALEAVIGAIYLDAGLTASQICIKKWYGKRLSDSAMLAETKDAKSNLQEWLQARQLPLPGYESIETGKAHELTFTVICTVNGLPHRTEGVSSSRRKAEQIAAREYLNLLEGKK